jgi:hypothetical protein
MRRNQKKGSSRNSGERSSHPQEEVFVITEPVGHTLDDFDRVVDPFYESRIELPPTVSKDAG